MPDRYVLECADDTLYTGYTTDPEHCVAERDASEAATIAWVEVSE